MAPLGWSGGSQLSSTVLPVGSPITVNIRGGEGAVALAVGAGADKEGHLNMATNMHECTGFGRVQSGLFTLMSELIQQKHQLQFYYTVTP